jgi:hypothetical protein
MDDYTIFKDCLMGKLRTRQESSAKPQDHPLWQIRTRHEANLFWAEQYAHLGAAPAGHVETDEGHAREWTAATTVFGEGMIEWADIGHENSCPELSKAWGLP